MQSSSVISSDLQSPFLSGYFAGTTSRPEKSLVLHELANAIALSLDLDVGFDHYADHDLGSAAGFDPHLRPQSSQVSDRPVVPASRLLHRPHQSRLEGASGGA